MTASPVTKEPGFLGLKRALGGLLTNPFGADGAESTWRSKRFQGILMVGAAFVAQTAGISLDDIVGVTNGTMKDFGVLWGLVGALASGVSARPF